MFDSEKWRLNNVMGGVGLFVVIFMGVSLWILWVKEAFSSYTMTDITLLYIGFSVCMGTILFLYGNIDDRLKALEEERGGS